MSNLFRNSMKDVFCTPKNSNINGLNEYYKHLSCQKKLWRQKNVKTQTNKQVEKKTSKHGCFKTQSNSSLVSIIRFLLSSSKSVWSYLKSKFQHPHFCLIKVKSRMPGLGSSLLNNTFNCHYVIDIDDDLHKLKWRSSYSLIAAQNITAETPSNRWIHFLLSFLCPPTSKSLYTSPLFLFSPTGLPNHSHYQIVELSNITE